jgi:Tfp pilus assembly protein PilF
MSRRVAPLLLVLLAATSSGLGQLAISRPCKVRIIVTTDQHGPIKDVNVELMDAVGFSSAMNTKITDSDGQVDFDTLTGLHRVRVYGIEIHEYSGEFDIEPRESSHLERIRVRLKPGAASVPSAGAGSVPAIRLRIPAGAQKEFHKGAQALGHKDWQEAKKRFEAAIARYPDYDLAYNGLGVALGGNGDQQAGRQAFEKAISLNPHLAEAYRNLSRISMSERKYEEADTLLTKSLDADPLNAWALTYAAYAELQLRKFSEAIAHARKAHDLPHQGLASVHIVAARALEATQQPGEALAEYRRYLEEDPNGRDAARAREAVARLNSSTSPKPPTTPSRQSQ